ncbi:hypothetical protein AAIR98_000539 [Elusimicrobium simillimum]|uniref:hypothetical protein n=1 Tax=Elusimicrobium simillimum TaxID=3143438 RepID=UPI003C704D41
MKKILAALLLCMTFTFAHAANYYDDIDDGYYQRLTDPYYMQGLGVIVLDTTGWIEQSIHGPKDKVYAANETMTIGFTPWLVMGAGISYVKYDATDEKDFLNPYAVARIRFLDRLFKIDVIGKVTFDAFDTVAEGGIESGTQKYDGTLIVGPRFSWISFGAKGFYQYWRKGTEIINPDREYMSNIGGAGFVSIRPLSFFDFGGEAGYIVYDAIKTKDEKLFYFDLNANFQVYKDNIALGAFYYYNNYSESEDRHALGARLKLAF